MLEQQKIDVKVSDVLLLLKQGNTREDIAAHYGLTLAEAKRDVFSHPKLKNKKTHKPSKVALIDDTPEVEVIDDTDSQESNLAAADLQQEELLFEENVSEMVNNQELSAEENSSNQDGIPATQADKW